MSEADLRRLRNDLETVQEAAGLTLPFDWADVWVALTLVPAGAVFTAVGAFVPIRWMLLCLVPFTAALVPYGIVVPLCSSREKIIYGGCAIMLAGLVAAAIQAGQLVHARRRHEPTSH